MTEQKDTTQLGDDLNKPKKTKRTVLIVLLLLILCAGAGAVAYAYQRIEGLREIMASEGIYPGVSIDGTDVGGMSVAAATELLTKSHSEANGGQTLTLYHENDSWRISFEEIGVEYQLQQAVDAAYAVGRSGTEKERLRILADLQDEGMDIPVAFSYDKQKMQEQLLEIAQTFNQPAQNSTMTRSNGKFTITREEDGREMDVAATMQNAAAIVEAKQSGSTEIVAAITKPTITYEDNERVTDLIGTFTTKYTLNDRNRNANLEVGCGYLNGIIIAPGEVFSATEGLGDQTYERGYRNAGVYVNGKVEAGMGGGVCQITTTLYNAAIFAELEIVERHPHSMTVGYVPLGRDAAIADYYKDLRIKNNTEDPIYIEASAQNGNLTVSLYGHEVHPAGRELAFETVYEATIPKPEEIVTEDAEKPEGEREVTHTGRTGAKVSVYKKVFENGSQVSKEWFSSSSYRAVADEVTVGTKKAEDAIEVTQPQTGDDTYTYNDENEQDNYGIQ